MTEKYNFDDLDEEMRKTNENNDKTKRTMVFLSGYINSYNIAVFKNSFKKTTNDPDMNITGDVTGNISIQDKHWTGFIKQEDNKTVYFKIIDNFWKTEKSPKGVPDKLILKLIKKENKLRPEQIGVLWKQVKYDRVNEKKQNKDNST